MSEKETAEKTLFYYKVIQEKKSNTQVFYLENLNFY